MAPPDVREAPRGGMISSAVTWVREHVGRPWVLFVSVLMVVTGSVNVLATKWADDFSFDPALNGEEWALHARVWLWQALTMFFGEFCCVIGHFFITRQSGEPFTHSWKQLVLLWIPGAMDMCGTSLMLNLTFASVFQMMRGSVIVFTAVLSFFWLRQRFHAYQLVGMVLVVAGLAVVGSTSIIEGSSGSAPQPLLGLVIIICAQMNVEQKILRRCPVGPMLAVGCEGFFGLLTLGVCLVIFNLTPRLNQCFSDKAFKCHFEDIPLALRQIKSQPLIIIPLMGTVVSIAFFNFAGLSVTKYVSATTRMVLDSARVVIIILVSLFAGMQPWSKWVSLLFVGFVSLVFGTFCFYGILPKGLKAVLSKYWLPPGGELDEKTGLRVDSEKEPLLSGDSPVDNCGVVVNQTPDDENEV